VPVDPTQFKTALSRWGSGVAVITTRDAAGAPVGLTASSFSSLSLQPPLILFCLGLDSTGHDAFVAAPGFAVHLLAAEQQALSARFATRGGEKFAGLEHRDGRWGAPLLSGCLAVLECRTHAQVPGGDHIIMVGEVEAVTVGDGEPLLYFRGAYRRMG
jgi:flavin reductase (DIM6/NTAB) family NADH-FMN oxidoreductase RutF